jgi:hypothetical protein
MKLPNSIFPLLITAGLAAGALTACAASGGQDRQVRILNQTSSPVRRLYVENEDRGVTGQNQLAFDDSIKIDHSLTLVMDDGTGQCFFDLKAVLADGRSIIRLKFNACEEGIWKLTDQSPQLDPGQ